MTTFEMADALKDACKHCTTIARANLKTFPGRRLVPTADAPTATVTFIEVDEHCYAVTANHVIQQFQDMAEREDVNGTLNLTRVCPLPATSN